MLLVTAAPGTVLQFRARARDAADNREEWPANYAADTATEVRVPPEDGVITPPPEDELIFRDNVALPAFLQS